jgi:hypothetical protein
MKISESLRAWAERLSTVALPIDVVAAEARALADDAAATEQGDTEAMEAARAAVADAADALKSRDETIAELTAALAAAQNQ